MHTKEWTVRVYLSETDDDRTHARAVLTTDVATIEGEGLARRKPGDPEIPEIGDELAASRALLDLAHELLDVAINDVQGAMPV
jgi:hypothetical protein